MERKEVFLVQHLQGYGDKVKYAQNEKAFTGVGFIRCRSEAGEDGKYWEVWLGIPSRLIGELRNAEPEEIKAWLFRRGPGQITITVADKMYGLGVD